jgi:hypothetical protein
VYVTKVRGGIRWPADSQQIPGRSWQDSRNKQSMDNRSVATFDLCSILINRLIDCLIDRSIDRLIGLLIDWSIDWVAWLIDRAIDWLIDSSMDYVYGYEQIKLDSNTISFEWSASSWPLCACMFLIPPSIKSNCSLDVKVQKLRFRFSLWITWFYFAVFGELFGRAGFSHSFLVYVIRKP